MPPGGLQGILSVPLRGHQLMHYTLQGCYNHAERHTVGMSHKGRAKLVGVGDKYFYGWVEIKVCEHV